jgi:hypothetical protein
MGERWAKGFVFDGDTMFAQSCAGAFQEHSVPEDDGSDDQVEATCALTLVLEAAVAQVTLPIEENGKGESVPGLALVEANLNAPAQLRVFHPLQHESERSMRPRENSCSWLMCNLLHLEAPGR